MNTAHVTIENVEKLAAKIAAAHGISLQAARDLAEFNLRFSGSYQEAAGRVAG